MLKYRLSTLFLVLMISFGSGALAQDRYAKEKKKLRKKGDFQFEYGDYLGALVNYTKLYKLDSTDAEISFRMGICEMVTNDDFSISSKHFKKASAMNHTESHFYLGNWHHLQNEFDQAVILYEKYQAAEGIKAVGADEISEKIASSKRAKEMIANPVEMTVENIGGLINSRYAEYVPLVSADESVLIFTSRRKGSTGSKGKELDQYDEDIYISHKDGEEWTTPVGIDSNINTEAYDACVGLSADGTKLITYKANDVTHGGDLYWSVLEGDRWQTPVKYGPNINSNYIEPSASLSSDGNTLYFSSNRPGGEGGMDIYRVKKFAGGEWSLPVNLGPTINTKSDDDAPFIHPDNRTLYFSSRGHAGMGGFDIFKSEMSDSEQWQSPENVGYPINSTDDDLYFVLSADGKRGYYSSHHAGGYGEQDIYVMHLPNEFKDLTIIRGTITAADSTKRPLKAKIVIRDYDSKKITALYHSNSKTGKYMLVIQPDTKLRMSVEVLGYLPYYNILYYDSESGFNLFTKPIALEPNN